MPNRIIKESINESARLSECSIFAEDLYKRLITYADDYGRFNSDTQIMRARLYPREYEYIEEQDIINGLIELSGVGKVRFYTAKHFNQGSRHTGIYGVFPNWGEHQRIRESKAKCPDPGDTDVNDWYLRRFVPLDMKAKILERDGFKCQLCGKFLTSCRDAKRFVKLGSGLFYIDHVVPCVQGGRATTENLRLSCPECNLKRKKRFTFKELLSDGLHGHSPQLAAPCGYVPPESNPNPNPNPNPNKNPSIGTDKPSRTQFSPPSVEEVSVYCQERSNQVDPQRFIDFYASKGWMVGKSKMKDWKACIRTWEKRAKEEPDGQPSRPAGQCTGRAADEKWGIKPAFSIGD